MDALYLPDGTLLNELDGGTIKGVGVDLVPHPSDDL